ncbi:hypothetical protein CGLO_14999 [Colletotrichum gloeosporioides Cg-14]|uniref:Uncharacterized protein n=1 Tax=Colletotrichum gloeosporioides (strain Cg-14) TaxID=1237896 RepID=T0JSE3_COLGC|nr:hypothetical protein CGLO_14999 [Colletotrichum gloeosporioides Cg-14]
MEILLNLYASYP